MRYSLSEILQKADQEKTQDEKVASLQSNDSPALRRILQLTFAPEAQWLLPKGIPPYKPLDLPDQQGRFYSEIRRLYLFLEGGNPNLKPFRREFLFVQLLESIDAEDANLLVHMKDGKLPYKTITRKIVEKAFPGLLPEVEKSVKAKK